MSTKACCLCGGTGHTLSGCKWKVPLESAEDARRRVAEEKARVIAQTALDERFRQRFFYR